MDNASPADAALAALRQRLAAHENVLCTLAVDLDEQLRFAPGLLALTDQRLLALGADGEWSVWPTPDAGAPEGSALELRQLDHAGVGTLELHDPHANPPRLLARWRFTLGANAHALRLVRLFGRRPPTGRPVRPEAGSVVGAVGFEAALCPDCGLPLPAGSDTCPVCAARPHSPPSTWVLLRLWRFARPYRWQLSTGFFLTLASTAATLVPPYLTIPLMDDILIPFQNGRPIESGKVGLIQIGRAHV